MKKYFIARRLGHGDSCSHDYLAKWKTCTEEFEFRFVVDDQLSFALDRALVDHKILGNNYSCNLLSSFIPFLFSSYEDAVNTVTVISSHTVFSDFKGYDSFRSVQGGISFSSCYGYSSPVSEVQYFVLESEVESVELPSLVSKSSLVCKVDVR